MKRITVSLDDDLYRIAKAYAISEDISLSKAVGRLLRRAVQGETAQSTAREEATPYQYRDPRTGLLVIRTGRTITTEEVQKLIDDDDLRHLHSFKRDEE